MVSTIRLFVEGDPSLKDGFHAFFEPLYARARKKGIRWRIVPCGSRNDAFDQFRIALRTYPEVFNVLLVDSEGPVATSAGQHLRTRDGWDCKGIDDARIQLMVQTMEAWFLADPDSLKQFYKQGFHAKALPKRANVEEIDKPTLEKRPWRTRPARHPRRRITRRTTPQSSWKDWMWRRSGPRRRIARGCSRRWKRSSSHAHDEP